MLSVAAEQEKGAMQVKCELTQGVDPRKLLHELRPASQQKPAEVLRLVAVAEHVDQGHAALALQPDRRLDGAVLGHDQRVLLARLLPPSFVLITLAALARRRRPAAGTAATDLRNHTQCLLIPIHEQQPARRLGHARQQRQDRGEHQLEREGEPPLHGAPRPAVLEIHGVADPVGQAEARDVGAGADDEQAAAEVRARALGEVDGADGRGHAHADAVDDAAQDELRQAPARELQHRAGEVEGVADGDGALAAELVAQDEGGDGAEEGAELGWG